MDLYCGIDWAEGHHDIAIIDSAGELLAKRRITDDAAGYRDLMEVLAEYGDTPQDPVPVAIETSQGLRVAALRAGTRKIYAVNPLSAARYRDRHGVSKKKSDRGMPWCWRTSFALTPTHTVPSRQTPSRHGRSPFWPALSRTRSGHASRPPTSCAPCCASSTPRSYRPARSGRTASPAPKPGNCYGSPPPRVQLPGSAPPGSKPPCAARDAPAASPPRPNGSRPSFGVIMPASPRPSKDAMGQQAAGLLLILDAACQAVDQLSTAIEEAFLTHPDAQILLSFPGIGTQLGARLLAEIGDDRKRFSDARALKAYAGSAPITRASGKKKFVGRRFVKNDRLSTAGYMWALSALTGSPGARAHYQRRRAAGDWHAAAQRNLFNRLLGQLDHCLNTRTRFDEATAFTPRGADLAA